VAVEVGVGDLSVAADAALLVRLFAAAVLLGQVAAELVLGVVGVASGPGELRRLKAALVRKAATVLVVMLLPFVLQMLRDGLVSLSHVQTSVRNWQRKGQWPCR
jgi:hypothetical protein